MGDLSTDQALTVIGQLQDIAAALSAFVITNSAKLSAADKEAIMDLQEKLVNLANKIADEESDLVFQDVDLQLAQLKAINDKIAGKLKTLGSIQKVIKVAADLVSLAFAISTFKPGDIASSAGDILDQLGIKIG